MPQGDMCLQGRPLTHLRLLLAQTQAYVLYPVLQAIGLNPLPQAIAVSDRTLTMPFDETNYPGPPPACPLVSPVDPHLQR